MENSKHEEWNKPQPIQQENKRVLAGIFALILGGLGVHKFILGYHRKELSN